MIDRVEATFANQKKQLNKVDDNYANDFTAPYVSGDYAVEVKAYDDAGNVTIASPENRKDMLVNVTKWTTPKTNWVETDRFNIQDYNRIKRNLEHLHEEANKIYATFNMKDMGADKEDYLDYFFSDEFNKFEDNLEIINEHIFTQDYGTQKRFFDNGPFIKWDELNRIENAILRMKTILESQKIGLRRLSFRFGRFKEVRV